MDSIIVLSAGIVGGLFVLRVIWTKAVENLLKNSDYDGIKYEDGTGDIWQ